MVYREIVARVASNTGLSPELVERTYRAYWRVIRDYLSSLPLKGDLKDEEFLALRTSVNIPSIGKLFVTLGRYKAMKESYGRKMSNKVVLCDE